MSVALIVLLATSLAGCVATGSFSSTNVTNVELSEDNFQIVATDVTGEASAGYLFGVSGSVGPTSQMQTFALVRVDGDGALYRAAIEDLWANFRAEHGTVEGRNLALVNVRFDGDALNALGLYTRPRISIRADIVEFGE